MISDSKLPTTPLSPSKGYTPNSRILWTMPMPATMPTPPTRLSATPTRLYSTLACFQKPVVTGANFQPWKQIWATFQIDFAEAYRYFCLSQAITQTKGFHAANNAMDSFVTDTAGAFANLATATASDRKLMADRAASNQMLLAQLATKDTDISKLQTRLVACNTRMPSSREGPARGRPHRYHNTNYCWTHRWDVHDSHSSLTCNRQADGHKTSATHSSTMGGTDANKNKVS
jgi:hypothetical protein